MYLPIHLLSVILTIYTFMPFAIASQGYEENSYDQPPSKMKFNIGFNLPSMSISLPKLELPQISIKASVKNKKPFTLKLPVIKFNGYANSEEDNSYGGGGNEAGGYGGGNNAAPAYAPGPTAYASGSGASGYVSALPENNYGGGQGTYSERPAAPTYPSEGGQYGQGEPAYASSGYSAATQAPSSPYQSKPQALHQTQAPHYQANQPQPHHQAAPQAAYQIHNSPYQAAANVYNAPTQSAQVVNSSPYTGTSPTAAANGYYVPRPVTNHQQQLPSYREEPKSAPVQLYHATGGNLYQAAGNPYEAPEHPASLAASAYAPNSNGGHQLSGYSTFHRRSNRLSNTHFPTFRSYETAAATLPEGRFVLAPVGDESTYKWQPILLRV